MDLHYDYIPKDVPASRKETQSIWRQVLAKGACKILRLSVVRRLFLKDDLAVWEEFFDWDLHKAVFLQNLAALVKNAKGDDPFQSRIGIYSLGPDR